MKRYCSTCKHGKPGPWVAATKYNERHRIVQCTYGLPVMPIWAHKLLGINRNMREMYRGRKETTCQTWENAN